jgi:hypothetical protein
LIIVPVPSGLSDPGNCFPLITDVNTDVMFIIMIMARKTPTGLFDPGNCFRLFTDVNTVMKDDHGGLENSGGTGTKRGGHARLV